MKNKYLISFTILLFSQNILFAEEKLQEINLQNIKIQSLEKEKTKKYYEKEDNLLKLEVPKYEKQNSKKEEDFEFDGSVGVDKETKSVDEVKINIGTKF